MMENYSLSDISAVTGAGRGIGRAIAIAMAEQGMNVIVNYNGSADKAEETAQIIREMGVKAKTVKCNVADFEECKKIPNDLTNGILSYNFKNNPFLDISQFFDYTYSHNKQSQSKNILTESSLYYKKLKIFVNGFIAEFS